MNEKIKVISFDLDDTLWPITAVIDRAQQDYENWIIEHFPQLHAQGLLKVVAEKQVTVKQARGGHCLTYVRKQSLLLALMEAGISLQAAKSASEHAFNIFHRARNNVQPFDGVTEMLTRLRKNYHLVSLTNGNVNLNQTVLKDHFDLSLNPERVGACKPDAKMFLSISEYFDVLPEQVLHVGDHYHEDVQGAQAAGLQALWIVHMAELESFWPERRAKIKHWLAMHEVEPCAPFVSCLASLDNYLSQRL